MAKTTTKSSTPKSGGSARLTRRELAGKLGVHMMSVTKWEREGLPIAWRGRRGKPSLYDEVAVRAWLQAREDAAQTAAPDLAQSRSRKELAQAMEAEQRVRLRAGELLAREEVEAAWSAEVAAVRMHLLSWSTTIVDRVHRAAVTDGVAGVEQALDVAVRDALRSLAAAPAAPQKKARAAA